MIMMVDYGKKMTSKKPCKYGEFGMIEHLLFFFILFFFSLFLIETLSHYECVVEWKHFSYATSVTDSLHQALGK